MIFVALLRGINVGGNNKVEMIRLKGLFESLGFINVKTYINSGNIIFCTDEDKNLTERIKTAVTKEFNLNIDVVIRTYPEIKVISQAVPSSWTNDTEQKTDIFFLSEEVNNESILDMLIIKPEIDTVKYIYGAIVWKVTRKNVTKSGLLKIIGTDLYKKVTVRNVNTLRKLEILMSSIQEK
jgi:uncharacterized protein (DUF1697 family)